MGKRRSKTKKVLLHVGVLVFRVVLVVAVQYRNSEDVSLLEQTPQVNTSLTDSNHAEIITSFGYLRPPLFTAWSQNGFHSSTVTYASNCQTNGRL